MMEKTVDEKRLKPTLIRRRAKPQEEMPVVSTEPVLETEPVQTQAQEVVASGTQEEVAPTASPAQTPPSTVAPVSPAKPATEVRRIGLVGHMDLSTLAPVAAPKEDWKERQVLKTARKRRSRAELELESIQRAGGLKHYADLTVVDETVEPGLVAPTEEVEAPQQVVVERVFRPNAAKKRKASRKDFKRTQITEPKAIKKVIRIEHGLSVSALSQATGHKTSEILKRLIDLGIMATINQTIDAEIATMIAEEYGYTVENVAFKEEDVLNVADDKRSQEDLHPRPPVVTIMGHVDHGKTSLLDAIRKTDVAAGEAGGITQHIGAYDVVHEKGRITFLDTPGHEAFTQMRARGAKVTDIVILVVAADDGVMPQTVEALNHAKAAGVPIIVAINKVDRPQANLDRVKKELAEHSLLPEDWGGDVICVPTSARTKQGVDKLLEMILLQAEVMELKASSKIRPKGVIVESRLDKGRGPVVTALIQEGTLTVGTSIVSGMHWGRVRAMYDAYGKKVDEAGPSKPVEILGLSGVPQAGDELVGVSDEHVKQVAEERQTKHWEGSLAQSARVSLEELQRQIAAGGRHELRAIVKADVHGSVEAVSDSLTKLSTDNVGLKILHKGVGGITESDVMLAAASGAIVVGFNVQPDGNAKAAANQQKVEIRTYRIIYEMIDDVKKAMAGLLSPVEQEKVLGRAEVREVFRISKVGQIAGCSVTSGKIARNAFARLLRDQAVVFEGKLSSLKRFKDDAREVSEGYECGIGIENYNDLKPGDVIEAYIIEKKEATL
ncbi:MAG: translation initiation factor IF-2 [Deltaproteobacteria bacterium]|nr:translation initiation factor IF-2 [Deltaproteobacteria bacterium]